MLNHKANHRIQAKHQQGVVLFIALIFLLLLTIIGVSAMNSSSLQEKMATNLKDKTVAHQAAESALNSAEIWIMMRGSRSEIFSSIDGILDFSTTGIPVWADPITWSSTNNVQLPGVPGTPIIGNLYPNMYLSSQPKYIIERMGKVEGDSLKPCSTYSSCKQKFMYRLTANATGGNKAAVTMLQTTFAKSF